MNILLEAFAVAGRDIKVRVVFLQARAVLFLKTNPAGDLFIDG